MRSYNLTCDEIAGMNTQTAILPLASLEQHGPHLPVSTDCIIAQAYAERIAKEMNAFQIPVIPISTCREHMGKMGSVWMNPDTFYHLILDICDSLEEQGFKKVVILQGHGGIFVLTPAIRQINATRNPKFMTCCVQLYDYLEEFRRLGIVESGVFLHADEIETSLILYLNDELVKKEKITNFVPAIPRPYLSYGSIFCASPDGVWGYPSYATAEKGKRLLEAGTELMVKAANEAFAYMENKSPQGYSRF